MVSRSELTKKLSEELVSIISTEFDVSNPYDHVDAASSTKRQTLPSLNYETQVTPIERGIHSGSYVDDVTYDSNEVIQSIVYARDKTLFFDVIASVPDDDIALRDGLYGAVEEWFDVYNMHKKPSDLHEDVDEIRVLGSQDESRPDDAVRGDRLSIEVDYSKLTEHTDITPMRDVETTVTVEDFVEDETSEKAIETNLTVIENN